ncbi:MAG TPA: PIN domain-containing protein [Chthonomonadales bacterium]|nr:PIN domain-containing protein [Chthonomonadales bacterium]
MNLRSFTQLFSALFALLLGAIGLTAGLSLPNLPDVAGMSLVRATIRELAATYPAYVPATAAAMAMLGVLLATFLGPATARYVVQTGNAIERMSARDKVAVALGTCLGVMLSLPFYLLLTRVLADAPALFIPSFVVLLVSFGYLGIRAMLSMKDELWFRPPVRALVAEAAEPEVADAKLLDTNVIIDGRIADIRRTGFIQGSLYVPGFVLDELQHIADSADPLKRARGRRGLDILNQMQKEFPLVVRSHDHLIGGAVGTEVDTRLVALARKLKGTIVTNDFNLNKVAGLQGVSVMNVNELANALKPVVLPGEEMSVTIIREGKEPNQGVAYLDDGTMIVVEDGRRAIGETRDVVVTSVLQTVAGKMIFARTKDPGGEGDDNGDGGRGRPGGGPGRKAR